MIKNIVILTADELRHQYFKRKLAADGRFNVIATFCETTENIVEKGAVESSNANRTKHMLARQQSEIDFFEDYIYANNDRSNSIFINRGEINNRSVIDRIVDSHPDYIIVYGASILGEELLSSFLNKILNVHLGLSPYYRGSGTNFWPLVDNLPECVGATFMYIDKGIDTGEIIHQIRAVYQYYDSPSTVGNRLIKNMTKTFCNLIADINGISKPAIPAFNDLRKFCKKKDFTEEAVEVVYSNFSNGMIEDYLSHKEARDALFPLVQNPLLLN